MVTIPTNEPTELTVGDYIQWEKTLTDYPAGTWTLTYALINSTHKITITAAADGTDHLVTVAAATSGAWTAGVYKWQSYVTSGSERYNIDRGEIKINPNYAAASTLDTRSHAKKTLDAIEAVIEGRAGKDQEEYRIDGRSLKRTPMADLIMLKEKYQALYNQEQNAEALNNGKYGKGKVYLKF
jgi:hypothetical protein